MGSTKARPPLDLAEDVRRRLRLAMKARGYDPEALADRIKVAELAGLSEAGVRRAIGIQLKEEHKRGMSNLWTLILLSHALRISSIDRLVGPTVLMRLSASGILPGDPHEEGDEKWTTLG